MFHKITIDEDKEIIETNLISPIILTKLLLPKIKK
jgi:short-subunit dehydrogenase